MPAELGFLAERVTGIEPALSAWEVCGAARVPLADSVTCGDLGGLSLIDSDCPWTLFPSGTQRARMHPRIFRRARSLLKPSMVGVCLTRTRHLPGFRSWPVSLACAGAGCGGEVCQGVIDGGEYRQPLVQAADQQ